MCKSASRSDLVLGADHRFNFFEPNTGNSAKAANSRIWASLCTESAANARIWGPPCTESAAKSRIWGPPCTESAANSRFGGLLALKVLQIPGFGGLLALKMLQIPGFGGSHCTESAANSKTWWPDTVNFQGLGARVHESNVNTGPSVIKCEAGISKTGKTLHSNSPQTDFKARDSEGRILKPQILKARIPKTGTLASHTS